VNHAIEYAKVYGVFTYTAVSVLEILFGLVSHDAHRLMSDAEASFKENEVIVPTLEDYRIAGRVRGAARRRGTQLSTDDCLIGAVAFRLKLPLITGNTGHFEAMKSAGLDIELRSWREK